MTGTLRNHGDGLLVYFGYPQAHEDDAQRAVRTGLDILAAMGDLNTHLQQEKGSNLLSVWASIRVRSLSVLWAGQDARNSWPWVKCLTLLRALKDSLRPIRLPSVTRRIA